MLTCGARPAHQARQVGLTGMECILGGCARTCPRQLNDRRLAKPRDTARGGARQLLSGGRAAAVKGWPAPAAQHIQHVSEMSNLHVLT